MLPQWVLNHWTSDPKSNMLLSSLWCQYWHYCQFRLITKKPRMGGGIYNLFCVILTSFSPLSQALHHWQIVSHTLGVLRLIIWTTNKQAEFKKPSYWQSVITSQNKREFLRDSSSFSFQLQRPITYRTVKGLFTKTTRIRGNREPIEKTEMIHDWRVRLPE